MADDRFGSPRKANKPINSKMSSSRSARHLKAGGGLDPPPMECSLAQLRQMSELELERTLDKAGVLPDEVDKALDEVAAVDTSIATIAEDQRKNALVMLLINSGKVKLVRGDRTSTGRQDSTRTIQTSNSFADSNYRDSLYDGTDASISSIPYNDETATSVRSGLSVSSSREERRKSKLDKIFELQTENSNVKRENKSLKKTIKKLLDQLTNVTQKEKEAAALAEKYRQEVESSGTMPIVEEEVKQAASEDAASDVALQTMSRRDSDQSLDKIKQKLKKEKDAHQSTEFRLKVRPDTFVILLLCCPY
jgi:myosin heavy subunit